MKNLFNVKDGNKKKRVVAGCVCESGELKRGERFRALRDGVEVYDGKSLCVYVIIASLTNMLSRFLNPILLVRYSQIRTSI